MLKVPFGNLNMNASCPRTPGLSRLLLGVLAASIGPSAVQAQFNSATCGAPIAFLSQRHGLRDAAGESRDDIYVMNEDGSSVTRLSDLSVESLPNWLPKWSPDGTKLVFDSPRSGGRELYSVDVGTHSVVRLTHNDFDDFLPVYSPDGGSIAFASEREGNRDIYVMGADGSHERRVTQHDGSDWFPTWSPDGDQIAFNSDRDGDNEVFVIDVRTKDVRQLTDNDVEDTFPHWSPDGRVIVFQRAGTPEHDDSELYVVAPDGSDEHRLTFEPGNESDASWSPDATRLVFASDATGAQEIYIMEIDGGNRRALTDTGVRDAHPNWARTAWCVTG